MPYLACHTCGFVRHTNPEAIECVKCRTKRLRLEFATAAVDRLKARNYEVHSDLTIIADNKAKVDVTNHDCGHRYTVQLCNLLSGASLCSICGPKRRMSIALKHWIAKYGKPDDYSKWEDYRYQVRKYSDKVYKANIHKLNPMGLPRGRPDLIPGCVQLDHIKPVIDCFHEGLSVEEAGGIHNLQVIDAIANLKKQRFTPCMK